MFECARLVLPEGAAISREPTRPPEHCGGEFSTEFDAKTLFYDVIAENGDGARSLIFVGPPLVNLTEPFLRGRIDGHELRSRVSGFYDRDRCCDVWIAGWGWRPVELAFEFGTYHVKPMPTCHHLYRGKRVLYTLSKNNRVAWIIDWARFHVTNHGADAVLLYDNASTEYTGPQLEGILRSALPGLVVNVVDWPFKYGPGGVSRTTFWDSDFCQAGAFQDARFRFLRLASSVLNCDIDELVVPLHGESIFEATERCVAGYVAFYGSWISNARDAVRPNLEAKLEHGQFRRLERPGPNPCPTKWCVVPGRCALEDQWSTHRLRGPSVTSEVSDRFTYRHFRAISTDWKYPRSQVTDIGPEIEAVDIDLTRCFERAGM